MNHEPLNDDERELARLYGQLPKAAPDPALDAAILAASRDALVRPRRRWPVALASAASLVLVASFAWQLRERPIAAPPQPRVTNAEPMLAKRAAPAPAPVSADELAVAAAPPPAMAAKPASRPRQAVLAQAAREVTVTAARAAPSAAMAPAPEMAKADAAPDPQARLRGIRELLARGDKPAAREELKALRKAYPGLVIPADVATLEP
jgi:hypothetical protein